MTGQPPQWRTLFNRFLHSWQAPTAVGVAVLAAMVYWLAPRPVDRIVPVDDSTSWTAGDAPPSREIVWQPAREIPALFDDDQQAELVSPKLNTNGTRLYFSRRIDGGQSDIYSSRLENGAWKPAEAVAELNTPANEVGPILSADGKQLYFYSDRDGGLGGTDIYVATQNGAGQWEEPRNLGPKVNSRAHEYDPAISPDGLSLYFASNRTDETAQRIAGDKPSAGDEWNITLRAQLDLTMFDLYRAHRDGVDADWGPSAALGQINRPDSTDGAPFVSPNGAFLYFASDRNAREGERRNLDLYRTRIKGDGFLEPENLGPGINTPHHETEPGLSPEGFTIVFSSNRDGDDRLYASTATEIYHDTEWDDSHLKSLGVPWWWWVPLTLAILAIILFASLYVRGWLYQKVWPARFFLGSVLVNLLLLLLLAMWTLPDVVDALIAKVQEVVPAPDFVDDNQHQSHEDGREAHEKVADLKSVEAVPVPQVVRKETTPLSVPDRTERLVPTIPLEQARALPPGKVIFVAPERVRPIENQAEPAKPQFARRRPQQPVLPFERQQLPDQPPELAVEAAPQDNAVAQVDVDIVRRQNAQPQANELPRPPQINPLTRMRPVEAAVAEVKPAQEAPTLPNRVPSPSLNRKAAPPPLDAVAVTETPALDAAADNSPNEPSVAASATKVERAQSALNNPASFSKPADPLPPPSVVRRQTKVELAASKLPDGGEGSEPTPVEFDRTRPAVEVAGVTVTAETSSPPISASDVPAEIAVAVAQVELDRTAAASPKAGLGAVAERPRTAEVPTTAAKPIAVAAANATPVLRDDRPVAKAADNPLSRPKRVAAADLTTDAASPAELAVAEGTTQLEVAERTITVAKSNDALADAPVKVELKTETRPAVAKRGDVELAQTVAESQPMNTKQIAAPLKRARPDAVQAASPMEPVSELPVELAAADRPTEATAETVEVALLRTTDAPLDVTVPTPNELTGPASRVKHRVVIGELSKERNDAPPAFSPLANRLDRRRARATRVAIAEDNVGLQSLFTLRQGETRKKYIDLLGGTDESEKAVNRGLEWLAKHQEKDGSWDLKKHNGSEKSNTAGTAFGLLPFLAAGYTHDKPGQYQKTVQAAIDWLLKNQKENGDLLGPGDGQHMYSHGIAAIALCEAYGMSRDEKLMGPARNALDFIVSAQHQGSGGWRYNPNQPADTSVVGWQMMALKSGEMAGLSVEKKVYDNVVRWLNSVEAKQGVSGTFGYTSRGSSPAMSAEGLLSLQFLRVDRNSPRMRNGADFLLGQLPEVKQKRSSYYWYYGTQVMYHMQGKYWDAWNENLRDILVETQIKTGANAGTWNPRDSYENRGGRVYATSLKLLMLEVYYRHLPLYEQLED